MAARAGRAALMSRRRGPAARRSGKAPLSVPSRSAVASGTRRCGKCRRC